MIHSMTGYGKAVAVLPGRRLILEVRSLNSKQLDLTIKIPPVLRDREQMIRALLARSLDRGKIDLLVACESSIEAPGYTLNTELALRYHTELKSLLHQLREDCPTGLLPLILKMPDVMLSGREELTDEEWRLTEDALREALNQLIRFRKEEGMILEADIRERAGIIKRLLDMVTPLEENRIVALREKLMRDFNKWAGIDMNGAAPDRNRFEQELLYYLERLDITEEKVRLGKHIAFFLEILNEETSQGKKLGFITQEMGREINTLGSKASDSGIQRLVVEMKDELEKIREQLGNVL